MVDIELTSDTLAVTLTGIDRFLAFKSRLEVPLEHVAGAEVGVDPEAEDLFEKSLRLPGAYMPGIAIEGRFYRDGQWLFYAVHSGENTITIRFHDEDYKAAVLEVDDPEGMVRRIREALEARGRAATTTASDPA
jgi:hypothetical protein